MKIIYLWGTICGIALVDMNLESAFADNLYVSDPGRSGSGSTSGALRYFDSTGTYRGSKVPSGGIEGLGGLDVGTDGLIRVVDNTLGYGIVHRIEASDGRELNRFFPEGYMTPAALKLGPDGALYGLGSPFDLDNGIFFGPWRVSRFDANTGGLIGTQPFAQADPGYLHYAFDLEFGPDSVFFVSAGPTVFRCDSTTGAVLGEFATVSGMATGLAVDGSGNLLVADSWADQILKFDPSGVPLGTFVASGPTGPHSPSDIEFGPDGNLYVASFGAQTVFRYDGQTGDSLGEFTTGGATIFHQPRYLAFGNPVGPEEEWGFVPEGATWAAMSSLMVMVLVVEGTRRSRNFAP